MTAAAALAGAGAGVAAVVDWWAVGRRSKRLEYVCKPAALLLLLVVAVALDPADPAQRGWFVAALALSLAGDVFLMLPTDAFVAGLGAFLLGHLAYVGGLQLEVGDGTAFLAAAAVVAGRPIVGGAGRRAVPVALYVTAISAMVASALATGDPVAMTGALLFYASDFLIGWTRFVGPVAGAPVLIMVTYHAGQGALVASLLA